MQLLVLSLNVKSILNNMKKAIAATNPAIRSGGMSFLSTLYRYTGASLYNAMDSVKIQVKPPMKQEIEKYADMKPPLPVRGVKKVKKIIIQYCINVFGHN